MPGRSRTCDAVYVAGAVVSIAAGTVLTLVLRRRRHVRPLCAIAYARRDWRICAAWVAFWDRTLEPLDGPEHCRRMHERWR